MEDILEVEYRIRATVYVLDELEKSYSEETDFKEKSNYNFCYSNNADCCRLHELDSE